jgi:putative intracellular protease/amidase
MSLRHKPHKEDRALLFIGDGFDEKEALNCLYALRDAGLGVDLVGLVPGLITGDRGLTVQGDLTLDQITPEDDYARLIIAGGRSCATALLADPRVHRIIDAAQGRNAQIVALASAAPVVTHLLPPSLAVVPAPGQTLSAFLRTLIAQVLFKERFWGDNR